MTQELSEAELQQMEGDIRLYLARFSGMAKDNDPKTTIVRDGHQVVGVVQWSLNTSTPNVNGVGIVVARLSDRNAAAYRDPGAFLDYDKVEYVEYIYVSECVARVLVGKLTDILSPLEQLALQAEEGLAGEN